MKAKHLLTPLCLGFVLFWVLFWILVMDPVSSVRAQATFSVTKTADTNDGMCNADCSLREAVMAANTTTGADTIQLPPGVYVLTRTGADEDLGSTGDLDITESVTILGAGADVTTVDGGGLDRVFHVISGSVTFSSTTITNGFPNTGVGGGILYAAAGGTLSIINSTLSSNSGRGVAITSSDTIVNIESSAISGNMGGGLLDSSDYNNNTINITNTVFKNNWVEGGGGGIANGGAARLNIVDSTFISNTATFGGGGILNRDTAVVVNIRSSTFSGNVANGDGGAIRESDIDGNARKTYNISDSSFTGNTTGGYGGAIAFNSYALFVNNSLNITNTTISGNRAGNSGGGISDGSDGRSGPLINKVNLNNVTITGNTTDYNGDGSGNGGGINSDFAYYFIANSIIAENVDVGGEAPDCWGDFTSKGYNLVGKIDGCIWTAATGDLTGTIAVPMAPLLGLLTGSPAYHPLNTGSPAIDAGNPAVPGAFPACAAADQRSTTRPQGTACDIGSYEVPYSGTRNIDPVAGGVVTSTDGAVGLFFPGGAVTTSTTVTITTTALPSSPVTDFLFAAHAFEIVATNANGDPVTDFQKPFTLTLTYRDADWQSAGIKDEGSLNVYYWNSHTWVPLLPCSGCSHDTTGNRITVVLDHMTEFALLAPEEKELYLPVVIKGPK